MTDRADFDAMMAAYNEVNAARHTELDDFAEGWQAALAHRTEQQAEPTRSQKLTTAGFTRRPTWKSLPSDAEEQQVEPVSRMYPTGIYAFAGWLTTRPGMMKVGSACDAAPMADAVGEYLDKFPHRFAAPPADDSFRDNAVAEIASLIRQRDEAVRLLREALENLLDTGWNDKLCDAIDAYLAKAKC